MAFQLVVKPPSTIIPDQRWTDFPEKTWPAYSSSIKFDRMSLLLSVFSKGFPETVWKDTASLGIDLYLT